MYRIKNQDSILGGVCLGLANYLKTDVTLVRAVFVILFFTPLPIGIAYLVLWAILPKYYSELSIENFNNQNFNENNNQNSTIMSSQNRNGNMVGGLILIILGAIFSFKTFFDINLFSYMKNLWPLILIGLGIWIIIKDKDDDNNVPKNPEGTGY
jgi:phage shock protein PspC (stress-responsive transcriptional regulator)